MAPSSPSTSRAPGRPCSALPIVLVDYDDAFRTSLAGMLRDDAHEVAEIAVPTDASVPVVVPRAALVIAEYLLPGQHGLTFAERCQRLRPDLPILLVGTMMTGTLQAYVESRRAMRALPKPLDYELLHTCVHELAG